MYNNSVLYIYDNGIIKYLNVNSSVIANLTIPTTTALPTTTVATTTVPTTTTALPTTTTVSKILGIITVYSIGYLFILQNNTTILTYNIKLNTFSNITLNFNVYAIAVDINGAVFVSTGDTIEKYIVDYSANNPTFGTKTTFVSGLGMCNTITYFNAKIYYISNTSKVIYSKSISDTDGLAGIILAGIQNYTGIPINGAYANTTMFYSPKSLVFDSNNNMYILDSKIEGESTIYKVPSYNFLKKDIAYIISGSITSTTNINQNIIAPLAKYGDMN